MKLFNLMALALSLSLSACIGGGGGSAKVVSDGGDKNAAQEPTPNNPESPEVPTISHSNLVVRVGGEILAYYLDGSGGIGRFIMADTGYIVSVDMWTGEYANVKGLSHTGHDCTGTKVITSYNDLMPNEVIINNSVAYKVTTVSSVTSRKSDSDGDGNCTDYMWMQANVGGIWNTLSLGSDGELNLDSYAQILNVQQITLPSFPNQIQLEVQ